MLWLLQALSGFAGPRATGQPRRSNVRSREAALNRQLPITRALTLLVKQVGDISDENLAELLEGAAFQEAALAAGIPTPALRRSRGGRAHRPSAAGCASRTPGPAATSRRSERRVAFAIA
jgi:hypothetical protein